MHLRGSTNQRLSMVVQKIGCRTGGHLEQGLLFLNFTLQKNTWDHRNMSPMAFLSHFGTQLHISLTDAHSLRCNLTIKAPTPADPLWYEAKCLVDEILILHLSNINKTMTSGDPGETANATEVGECLTQPVNDLCQKLRDKVSNTKVDTHKTNGKYG